MGQGPLSRIVGMAGEKEMNRFSKDLIKGLREATRHAEGRASSAHVQVIEVPADTWSWAGSAAAGSAGEPSPTQMCLHEISDAREPRWRGGLEWLQKFITIQPGCMVMNYDDGCGRMGAGS